MAVLRFDIGNKLAKAERTPQGGIRVAAAITRTGVLRYLNADGSERLEYRSPGEVFAADSLASLDAAPVTRLHPGQVTPANWQSVAKGHVVEGSVRQADSLVAAKLAIQDAGTIEEIDRGELVELSAGYTCDVEPSPGVSPDGERYDCIQQNIRYNHVALLPEGKGRAGGQVSLRLDSKGDCISPIVDTDRAVTEHQEKRHMKIRIDGIDYEAGSTEHLLAQAKADERSNAALATEKSRADKEAARADAAEKRADKAEADLQAALDPSKVAERVKARVALETAAAKADPSLKCDGLSDAEIMISVIRKDDSTFDPKDRSADYIVGRYEAAVANINRAPRSDGVDAARVAAVGAVGRDDSTDSYTKARNAMIERNRKLSIEAFNTNDK